MESQNKSRRSFLRQVLVGAGAIVLAPVIKVQNAVAAMVDLKNPLAIALNYVADATASKHKNYKKGQTCGTCTFFTVDAKDAKIGKCTLIQVGDVATAGWCQSFNKKPEAKKAKS